MVDLVVGLFLIQRYNYSIFFHIVCIHAEGLVQADGVVYWPVRDKAVLVQVDQRMYMRGKLGGPGLGEEFIVRVQ